MFDAGDAGWDCDADQFFAVHKRSNPDTSDAAANCDIGQSATHESIVPDACDAIWDCNAY